jgi:hypothetical protein
MIRLCRALSDNCVRVFLLCLTHEEFEFSGFVTASGKSGTVVTFDENLWTAEQFA